MDTLGQSQIATMMDLYSHVLPSAQQAAANLMDCLVMGTN